MKEKKKQLVPIGVRFNLVHFSFVKEKEKLETHQSVVNFLLKDYFDRVNQPAQEPVATQLESWEVPNNQIWEVILQIALEKCPNDRNTTLGKSVWEKERLARIQEMKNLLK